MGKEAKASGVAIAYNTRYMSHEFAMEAAKTLGTVLCKIIGFCTES